MNSQMTGQNLFRLSQRSLFAAAFIFSCQITNLPIAINNSALAKTAAQKTSTLSNEEKPTVSEETINGKCFCVSRILVKARPDQVWKVLSDYKHAVRIFTPLLTKCEVLEDHGSTKIAKHEIAPSGIPDTFEYVLEIKETAGKCLEWRRISGDFKEVDGSWKLEPVNLGNYTMVTYASHVNGGFFMPQMLIKHQSHIDMPNTLLALKRHTEHSIEIASRRTEGSADQPE